MGQQQTPGSKASVRQRQVDPLQQLGSVMQRAGWEVDYLDLDLTAAQPVMQIRCHRADGLWIFARADVLGRCSMETFHRQSWLGRPTNAVGRWPLSPQVDDVFLGRQRFEGPRALLRHLTRYVVDNAVAGVAMIEMRRAWGGVMSAPAKWHAALPAA